MKKRILAFSLILLVVINASALVTFSYNRWFKTSKPQHQVDSEDALTAMKTRLCLSDDQLERMRHVRIYFESECGEIQTKMQEKRKALVTELKKPSPDTFHIEQIIDDINHLQSRVQKEAVHCLIQEKDILNPEQQKEFIKMVEDHFCSREVINSQKPNKGKSSCRPQDNKMESESKGKLH